MNSALSILLIAAMSLANFGCLIYLLYLLYKEKGGLHALLGFFFPIYPYLWGWIGARQLGIVDIMVFWTIISIGLVVFPMILGFSAASQLAPAMISSGGFTSGDFSGTISTGSDIVSRGPIAPGSQVEGRIDDLFGIDEDTLAGSAGGRVTIWAQPSPGSNTGPRLKVYGPNGFELASDDDGGGGKTALLDGLILPADGTYRIQVDVWTTGPYVLGVE